MKNFDKIIMMSPEYKLEMTKTKELAKMELDTMLAVKNTLLTQLAEVSEPKVALFLAIKLNNVCYDIAELSKCLGTGLELENTVIC